MGSDCFPAGTGRWKEDDLAGSDVQQATEKGRLGLTPMLRHHLHGTECPSAESHGSGAFWSSPSVSYPNFQEELSSSSYGPLLDLSYYGPIAVVVKTPRVNKVEVVNSTDKFHSLFPTKTEELPHLSNEPNHTAFLELET